MLLGSYLYTAHEYKGTTMYNGATYYLYGKSSSNSPEYMAKLRELQEKVDICEKEVKKTLVALVKGEYENWVEGETPAQQSEINYSDGSYYKGYVDKDGQPHGKGRIVWANGDSYEGDFVHNIREGVGSYVFASGTVYSGEFYNNKMTGEGVYLDILKGVKMSGSFLDGIPNGYMILYDLSGNVINSAFFENGKIIDDRPSAWAEEILVYSRANNLIPGELDSLYKTNITRSEFCQVAIALIGSTLLPSSIESYVESMGKTIPPAFEDTDDIYVLSCTALGLVSGVGNNKFNPDEELTREQAAVILARLAKLLEVDQNNQQITFSDDSYISSWAKDSVSFMANNEIMNGVGENRFDPQGKYTREQSFITVYKLQQKSPLNPVG